MFKNYFTIALRTLWKNKVFTAINILGLSIGISASLVIYLLVNYHFTFDKFEKDADRIYRVVSNSAFQGEVFHLPGVASPLGSAVRKELTGIDEVAAFRTWDRSVKISVPATGKNEPAVFKNNSTIIFADENYFSIIGYQWVAGSAKTSLHQPYETVLTESKAKLYFPALNAAQVIGKELYFDDTIRTTVTGVVEDIKNNTDFTFKIFISKITLETTSLKPSDWDKWDAVNSASQLFVKLSAGISPSQIEKGISKLSEKYHKQDPGNNNKGSLLLQPLYDIHFNEDYGGYDLPLANKPTLYGLLAVAAFLLLLGCINFINLTTAHAALRAKEIGIRKTMGSSRKQLIFQFLGETFLLTFFATALSVALTPLILKAFSGFLPEDLSFTLTAQPGVIVFLILLMIVVTVLSGFYPALILSGYKPVLVLKNQAYANTGTTRSAWLRKSLTVLQFVIAQVFIMATILVSKQINYSLNKNMGFKKDAILFFNTSYSDKARDHRYVLMDKLRAIPEVAMVSLSNAPPSSGNWSSSILKYKDGKKEIETEVQFKYGDTNYIKCYQLKLLAGANLEPSDTIKQFIINEMYAHIIGFQQPQQAIGKYLERGWQIPITGVVADFNQFSLHEPIKPLVICSSDEMENTINIALQPQNASGTTWKTAIKKIEKAWKEVYPEKEFFYTFFDEDIAEYYDGEKHLSTLLMWATGLAVFISCLGLLGLVIHTTTQRTKEIGVRKVLGATVSQIVALISKDFIKLVLFAFVIAAPIAWFGMHKWLNNFAYRTEITWWIFIASAVIMIFIALLTLSIQTIRAAIVNPVKSLRAE